MTADRRSSERIRIDAVSQFLIKNEDSYGGDFEGIINNISDTGLGVIITKEKYFPRVKSLKVDDPIFFQALDEYTLFNKPTSDIFQGKIKIVRIEETDEGYYIGCSIESANQDLQQFISRRKMAFFIDGLATPK